MRRDVERLQNIWSRKRVAGSESGEKFQYPMKSESTERRRRQRRMERIATADIYEQKKVLDLSAFSADSF